MTLLELAAKVEALTAACRETDGSIYIALNIPAERAGRIDHIDGLVGWWPKDAPYQSAVEVPRYTASLDAAMMLVPEGWIVTITRMFDDDGEFWSKVILTDSFSVGRGTEFEDRREVVVHGPGCENIVVAAALRARAAIEASRSASAPAVTRPQRSTEVSGLGDTS